MLNIKDDLYVADIDFDYFKKNIAQGFVIANSTEKLRRMPFYENKFFEIYRDSVIKKFNVDDSDLPISLKSKDNIVVYPSILSNRNETINIDCGFYSSGKTQIRIYNTIGNLIYQKYFDMEAEGIKNLTIDVSAYSVGLYNVFCFRNNEILRTNFIIID